MDLRYLLIKHIYIFRFFHWTIACLWPLFSTSFTVPCLGSEQLAYAAAGLKYPSSFSANFYFTYWYYKCFVEEACR